MEDLQGAANNHEHYYGFVGIDLDVRSCMSCGYINRKDFHLAIDKAVAANRRPINDEIDVRYAPDLETAFDRFIEKWCQPYYSHLIDSDDNDGQFIRDRLAALQLNKENR